ncbi:GPRMTH5 [Trypoxylus dichotomus]
MTEHAELQKSRLGARTIWQPTLKVHYTFSTGFPNCGSHQKWPIYSNNSTDILQVLPNGVLRHSLYHPKPTDDYDSSFTDLTNGVMHYDYEPGKYCTDKMIDGETVSKYALVCIDHTPNWTNPEFLMRNIVNPVTHGITIVCLLFIACVYFIMPTLRDLVGNIVTTISICLVVSQIADMVRLLTIFTSHISLIITETFCYISLLGAFFWLNSLSYYIWKTFKSRNVFLRITDGRKYCYYSMYCWSCTIILGLIAIFAHYTMDYPTLKNYNSPEPEQESIGSLGIIIFFMPVAITVLINTFFFATTFKIINRMNTYGRIHHKLKHSFRMFLLLFLVMTDESDPEYDWGDELTAMNSRHVVRK